MEKKNQLPKCPRGTFPSPPANWSREQRDFTRPLKMLVNLFFGTRQTSLHQIPEADVGSERLQQQQPAKSSKKKGNEVKQHNGLGCDCVVLFFFPLPVIVPCCIFPLCLPLPSNHRAELRNNLLLVSRAEWILLLIVEVNTLFEYDQSPVIKGPLWFMKYSSKVSPGDSDAFRCISQNLKQTPADKRLRAESASVWTTRQSVTKEVTSAVETSPCRSAGFQPLHLLINQQEHTQGSSS